MKKFWAIILTVVCAFSAGLCFTSCSKIMKERQEREDKLLAIEGVGGHYFVDTEGYILENERVYFSDLIMEKIEKDGVIFVPRPKEKRYQVDAKLRKDTAYFSMRYNVSEENKDADVIVGYIHIKTNEIVYYNTHISTREEYGIYLMPKVANDNYFIFRQIREYSRKDVYYVIDVANGVLMERVSDITPYQDGTENAASFVHHDGVAYEIAGDFSDGANSLVFGEERLMIDYSYVLARSEEMKQIDDIVGQYKRSVREHLIAYQNRLYVVVESDWSMFGGGELIPVVFEYHFETDSFTYIGATNQTWQAAGKYIFGIIPED